MKLHCTNCNYQYSPKTGKKPDKCPYCSTAGSLEPAKQVQDWIDEVDLDTRKE